MTADPLNTNVDEELALLVRSLDDLDAELAAGDLDPVDYRTLRDDYTIRVADALRRAETPAGGASGTSVSPTSDQAEAEQAAGSSRWLVLLALGLFAVGAGWLLARSAGERGIGDALTGSIDRSARQRVADCQDVGMADGDLLGAIQCFDDVLTTDPENVEALTYRAWFLVLASGAAADAGGAGDSDATADSVEAGQRVELLEAAQVYLDEAIDIDPGYADARAFRSVVADRLGESDEVCLQVEALIGLDPPPFFIEQTRSIAERNDCRT